ncbi:MAG: carboxypeptidase-like regulatory domain-containing protein [Acidobacteriota bacterium]|nr:carboxypeptidase-like regulatory domain-containing protein [Acidobacteriota bacterium]
MKVRSYIKALILILASGSLIQNYPFIQSSVQSSVRLNGVVVDLNDARVVNASVVFESNKIRAEVRTNEEGDFQIDLPPGNYKLIVKSHGFRTYKQKNLKVAQDATKQIKIVLQPAPQDYSKCPKGVPCL